MPIDASAIERGYLVKVEDEHDEAKRLWLHFNPVSLTYSVEATTSQQKKPDRTGQTQYAAEFSAKLSFDAVFDNTDTGEDIRLTTKKVAQLLRPAPTSDDSGTNAPARTLFQWGAFRFTGVVTQYRETIDFFAKEGVALRSTVSLTLVEQEKTLDDDSPMPAKKSGGARVPTRSSDSALSAATRGGDPRAARTLASANGLESLRFTGGATLEVDARAGVSASAGFAGSTGDASASWNATGSGSLFGAQSSAGISASAGAFAGLSSGAGASASISLDPSKMLSGSGGADLSAHAGANFSVGGSALMTAGVGLSADVGARANWKDLLQFDDEA